MRITLAALLLATFASLSGQHYTFSITNSRVSGELPVITGEFFSYYFVPTHQQADWLEQVQVRFSSSREQSNWRTFAREVHNPDRILSQLYHADAEWTDFSLQLPNEATGTLHIYDPGRSVALSPTGRQFTSNDCPCIQPTIIQRQNWCPANNCPEGTSPSPTIVTHLVVHHSATSNTSNDWPA